MTVEGSATREHHARRGDSMSLLTDLVENSLDDYQNVPVRDGPDDARSRHGGWVTVAVVALFAVIVTVAAVQTRQQLPQVQTERAGLIDQIEEQKAEVHAKQQQAEELRRAVADLQIARPGAVDREETRARKVATGVLPVTGPGVRIVVDNAEDVASNPQGRVLDRDLQRLVNGLWIAGAEAIAINGNRLSTLSSIRSAGEAITVNYNSLSPPYVVSAIGNPRTLQARFLESDAGQVWANLRSNFGLGFEMTTEEDLHLPAAPDRRTRVRVADRLQEPS